MNKYQNITGTIEIVIAFSLAGSSIIVAKMLSASVPVFLTCVLSLTVALVTLLPFQWKYRRELRRLTKREVLLMFFQAVTGIVLFRIFTLYGLRLTTATDASIITAATPAIMALLSIILLRETINIDGMVGVLAALAGLILINLDNISSNGISGTLAGNLLIGLAVVSEVLMTIFRKTTRLNISSITNTTILVSFAIGLMLPFAILEIQDYSLVNMKTKEVLSILYYGAIATAAAYIFWGDGALKIPATYTGVASVSMPISALLLSHWILGEELFLHHVLGSICAILGIIFCQIKLLSNLKNYYLRKNTIVLIQQKP